MHRPDLYYILLTWILDRILTQKCRPRAVTWQCLQM